MKKKKVKNTNYIRSQKYSFDKTRTDKLKMGVCVGVAIWGVWGCVGVCVNKTLNEKVEMTSQAAFLQFPDSEEVEYIPVFTTKII